MPRKPEAVITVAGLADDSAYTKACIVAQELADALGNQAVECQYFMEQPWDDYLRVKQAKVRGRCISHKTSPLILVREKGRDHYVGSDRDLDKLFQAELGRPPSPIDMAAVDKTTLDRYLKILSKSGNPYVYLDVQFAADRENTKPRKVVIELFSEVCPKSCAHFRALCTGQLGSVEHEGEEVKLHYRGCPFHRVVKNGFVCTGDVVSGNGMGNAGEPLADEHFGFPLDVPGTVGFARGDAPHTNHQQFFITLSDQSWLQTKAVAFGRVVKGLDAIRQIGSLPLKGERPVENVIIANCNVVNLVDGFGLGHGGGM